MSKPFAMKPETLDVAVDKVGEDLPCVGTALTEWMRS
jgi:hypothetical protein